MNIMAQSLDLFQEFNNDVKDLDLFLIKKEYIPPFPKTAFNQLYEINTIL